MKFIFSVHKKEDRLSKRDSSILNRAFFLNFNSNNNHCWIIIMCWKRKKACVINKRMNKREKELMPIANNRSFRWIYCFRYCINVKWIIPYSIKMAKLCTNTLVLVIVSRNPYMHTQWTRNNSSTLANSY